MESFLLGIGILYSFVVWRAWKRTALDTCRDTLFDVRDEARTYFISRNIALDNPTYLALRNLINAHIRYTERLTFPGFVATAIANDSKQSRELLIQIRREIENTLSTDDQELKAYIAAAREKATEAMLQYIGETSAFMIFTIVAVLPFVVIYKIIKLMVGWLRDKNHVMTHGLRSAATMGRTGLKALFRVAPIVGLIMAAPAKAGLLEKEMTSATMLEEYSYEASRLV